MDIENIRMLPKTITSPESLFDEFEELFGSKEALVDRGVVYFFMSLQPIPRVRGKSNILYIGRTNQSLKQRYFRYCKVLASGRSGKFYKHIIDYYGGITVGYIVSENPKAMEAEYFRRYCDEHCENPPKSKVG